MLFRSAENGLCMLAHQARLAFLAWTGVAVPADVFLNALYGPDALRGPDALGAPAAGSDA